MTPRMWTSYLLVTLVLLSSSASFAQTDRTVKRRIAAVLFSGLGGAILGLSTLSFYGEPQEHTENISYGALLGFVAGVGYVIYDSSRPAAPVYEYSQIEWDLQKQRALASTKAPVQFQYSFSF